MCLSSMHTPSYTYLPYVAAHIFHQVEETQKHAEKAEAEADADASGLVDHGRSIWGIVANPWVHDV